MTFKPMKSATYLVLAICAISSTLHSEELSFNEWKRLIDNENRGATLIDLSVDGNFFVAVYASDDNLTSVCFWYRHGYIHTKFDSTLIRLNNGEKIDWSKIGDDIPLRIVHPDGVAQYFTGYSGAIPLEDIAGISLEVNAVRDLTAYKLLYELDIDGRVLTTKKQVITGPAPPQEPE